MKVITDICVVAKEPEGYVRLTFTDGAAATGDTVPPLIGAHTEVAESKPWPTLVDLRGMGRADRRARELASGPDVAALVSRMALLVGGPVSAVIGNFFLGVTRPEYPIRMFADESAALEFLEVEVPDE